MELKITKKQNVVIDGIKYVAARPGPCGPCALKNLAKCNNVPCTPSTRDDRQSVHFVRKGRVWTKANGVIPDLPPDTKVKWKNVMGHSATTPFHSLCWAIGEPNEIYKYKVVE